MTPDRECNLCPRLAEFRAANRESFPGWHNAPVAAFGPLEAPLLIVGLAPGLRGANRTGRPFTGDFAGDLLYPTLLDAGLGQGRYGAAPDDGLRLTRCRITNAVRCVPPQNKPTGSETKACRGFLTAEIAAMPNLEGLLALGVVAHKAILAALGHKQSALPFAHGAVHDLSGGPRGDGDLDEAPPPGDGRWGDGPRVDGLWLADSYHCSRYNTNTGRLTEAMFREVFAALRDRLDGA
ncbi:MAG: uracil-DNA glycosylase [Proteobacteria bacterium]|nr:uracil-DNA glycosylase [Pseudomonadota bacterium]